MNKETFRDHIGAMRRARDDVTAAQCLLIVGAVETIQRKAGYIREAAARGIVVNSIYECLDIIQHEADDVSSRLQELDDLK